MDFLESIDSNYYFIGLAIIYFIGNIIVQRRNSLRLTLQYRLYAYVTAMMLISLSIPHVFSGHPNDITEIENKKRLLYYLQDNNETLVSVTKAFKYIFFASLFFAFSILTPIIKNLKIIKSVD